MEFWSCADCGRKEDGAGGTGGVGGGVASCCWMLRARSTKRPMKTLV